MIIIPFHCIKDAINLKKHHYAVITERKKTCPHLTITSHELKDAF